jgi:hypothetical protein
VLIQKDEYTKNAKRPGLIDTKYHTGRGGWGGWGGWGGFFGSF